MRNRILILYFVFINLNGFSQGASFYSIESEYTTTFGYRYFFDKTNSATGVSTQLSQLPIAGYYMGYKFFNCFGNYVFCGVDSSTTSPPFLYKLFEIDTLGNVVRTLPVSSTTGSGPDLIHANQSFSSQMYYGIRWNGGNVRQFVSIDPLTGVNTVIASISIPYHSVTPVSAIAPGNNFYFLEQNNMTTNRVLYKADFASATITASDSAVAPNDIVNLAYDCVQDSVVGFYCPFPYNVNGAEWIKINNATGKVRNTGTYFSSGSGSFYSGGFTFLNGGDYYAKIASNVGLLFDPASVTGASYAPFATYLNPLDLKLLSAPEKHCTNYFTCSSVSVNEIVSEEENIKVYPNPFSSSTTFLITSEKDNRYSFELTDVLGKQVRVIQGITEKQFSISRDELGKGIYFYKIHSSDALLGVGKVVIE